MPNARVVELAMEATGVLFQNKEQGRIAHNRRSRGSNRLHHKLKIHRPENREKGIDTWVVHQ